MTWDDEGPKWRGCRFIPFLKLPSRLRWQIRDRWSRPGARGSYRYPEAWAFAVTKRGRLARCPYIEPVSSLETLEAMRHG